MITKAAVLRELGLPRAYAQSRPLIVQDMELSAPGPGEILVRVGRGGALPFGSVRDRRDQAEADADGSGP